MRDVMSDILTVLDARAVYAGGLRAGGTWTIRFPPPSDIKFFAIAEGGCVLTIEGKSPVRLERGDVFLYKGRVPFFLSSEKPSRPLDAVSLFRDRADRILTLGNGKDFVMLGSHLSVSSTRGRLLVDSLPSSFHLKARDAAPLRWLLEQFIAEAQTDLPGAELACASLAQLMFLHVLRVYVQRAGQRASGWLRVASDVELAPALQLMHGDPSKQLSLVTLARAAGMSRTRFATYFREVAGTPPLTYVTEWRMQLAERRLREDKRASVGSVARAVGYESEAAFSTAFKRVMGHSPRRARAAK